jgi:hypothetical protein
MRGKDNIEQEPNDDKCMIIVPVSLLAKIDLNRDKLSRAEFVELCIDTLTERGDDEAQDAMEAVFPAYRVAQPKRHNGGNGSGVTRSEFDELKSSIKDMMRSFVESLPQHMAENWSQATSDANERSQQLMELLED